MAISWKEIRWTKQLQDSVNVRIYGGNIDIERFD